MVSMPKLVELLRKQRSIELSHADRLAESMEQLEHPLVRVLLEAILHDSRKHAAVCQALIDVEAGSVPLRLDVNMGSAVSLHQDIRQHVAVEAEMIKRLEEMIGETRDDRVKAFLGYLLDEEQRHHSMLSGMSNIIDRDSVAIDEYLGLFEKYMIVPPE
jgi:rubrerythrin